MSEKIVKHQFFNLTKENPFEILFARPQVKWSISYLNHWHDEIEIVYTFTGYNKHYINGECIVSSADRLITVNSGFIHGIVQGKKYEHNDDRLIAMVIILDLDFVRAVFPQYDSLYFTNDKTAASQEIKNIIEQLFIYKTENEGQKFSEVYAKGLLVQLLYALCKEGVASRNSVDTINKLKNVERMKGVISYIENHYMERLPQSDVAKKYYFTPEYFSRYFKECTGYTFVEYLRHYRIKMARQELLKTNKTVTEIALENGFSDVRRFIIGFRESYGMTPLQYRKSSQRFDE